MRHLRAIPCRGKGDRKGGQPVPGIVDGNKSPLGVSFFVESLRLFRLKPVWLPIKHKIDYFIWPRTFTGEQGIEIPGVYVESSVMGDGDSFHNGSFLSK